MPKTNILLIGMPGSGKTVLGKLLAEKLDYIFIDLDSEIEKHEKATINEILETKGDKELLRLEEKEALAMKEVQRKVISPGGSIIYSKKAMDSLKENSKVIYLELSLEEIKKRLKNAEQRGIVGLKEKGLDKLYEERTKLYKRYSDETINAENLNSAFKEIVTKLCVLLKGFVL